MGGAEDRGSTVVCAGAHPVGSAWDVYDRPAIGARSARVFRPPNAPCAFGRISGAASPKIWAARPEGDAVRSGERRSGDGVWGAGGGGGGPAQHKEHEHHVLLFSTARG